MPENTENLDLINVAQEAVEPHTLADGIWLTPSGFEVTDLRTTLEEAGDHPHRVSGDYAVTDVDSFVSYVQKHGNPATEVWAKQASSTIRAVINAHAGADTSTDRAGWGDHTVALHLSPTPDWRQWTDGNGKVIPQLEFAEFIEDHLPNFVTPVAADMLELAQTFQAKTNVDFASSQRVKSGETRLNYAETTEAKAGEKGALAIPDEFTLALQPYEGGEVYRVTARFRFRIHNAHLLLGYRLNRPDDILRDAFTAVVNAAAEGTDRTIWATR